MDLIEKPIIFMCSGTLKAGEKKRSFRLASYLANNDLAEIGSMDDLNQLDRKQVRRKMIFVSDCRSSCVRILTEGLVPDQFLFVDLFDQQKDSVFDIEQIVRDVIKPYLEILIPGSAMAV